jgi:hypothetical protein
VTTITCSENSAETDLGSHKTLSWVSEGDGSPADDGFAFPAVLLRDLHMLRTCTKAASSSTQLSEVVGRSVYFVVLCYVVRSSKPIDRAIGGQHLKKDP